MYILIYIVLLLGISFLVSRRSADNKAFFTGHRKSPWYLVAFGMLGATVSGITIISVPGMVLGNNMTYFQTVLGFFFGYLVVAYGLLPLYYKKSLTSIYALLGENIGPHAQKTGSGFFILAKLISTGTKLYIALLILDEFVLQTYHIPFVLTTFLSVLIVWFYTRKSGIQGLVWTDSFQTLLLITSLTIIGVQTFKWSGLDMPELINQVKVSTQAQIFEFDNLKSAHYFWKAFLSGIFIVIVMTGLDQDMMQKNLTCKTPKDAQRNMIAYGFLFIPLNAFLLFLGAVIILYASKHQMTLPVAPDKILPSFVHQNMSPLVGAALVVGVVSASLSSVDSALTSITTSLSIDFLHLPQREARQAETLRKRTHILVCLTFCLVVLIFRQLQNHSILDLIYRVVGYCYGPLLGLFAYALFFKRPLKDKFVPYVCILSPIVCYMVQYLFASYLNYQLGYELLILNGALTLLGLSLLRKRNS